MTEFELKNAASVHQINVSQGGVPKLPVLEAAVGELGLEGDAVANPDIHGGPERAVCLYSLELIEALVAEGVRRRIERHDLQLEAHALQRQHLRVAERLGDDGVAAVEVGDSRHGGGSMEQGEASFNAQLLSVPPAPCSLLHAC